MNLLIKMFKRWWVSKYRRVKLIHEIQNAEREYQEGRCKVGTSDVIMKEILGK